eukprot:7227717-Pyramimonas_sp.AAC.1
MSAREPPELATLKRATRHQSRGKSKDSRSDKACLHCTLQRLRLQGRRVAQQLKRGPLGPRQHPVKFQTPSSYSSLSSLLPHPPPPGCPAPHAVSNAANCQSTLSTSWPPRPPRRETARGQGGGYCNGL